MNEMLTAALVYAGRKWRVFPVEPGGKKPLGRLAPDGVHNATTSDVVIRAWWEAEPNANVGVATGEKSGLLVLDVDECEGSEPLAGSEVLAALTAHDNDFPLTVESITGGGGSHYWFAYPKTGRWANTASKIAPGIDTRGEGGYVVAPPSRTQAPYKWVEGPGVTDIAPAPDWLLDLLRDKPAERPALQPTPAVSSKYAEKALSDEITSVAMAHEGSRNATLNSAAFSLGQLVGANLLDESTVSVALLNAALTTGLSESEARATIRSGLGAGLREPRDVPAPRNSGSSAALAPVISGSGAPPAPPDPDTPAPVEPDIAAPAGQRAHLLRLSDALTAYFASLDKVMADGVGGVPTGFADLDRLTGGLKSGDFIILAARPSVGKSAFAFNLARNAAGSGTNVLVFSLEMSAHQIAERLLAAEAGVDATRLRQGYVDEYEWQRVSQAYGALIDLPIWLDETAAIQIGDLTTRAAQAVAEHGIGLVVVDYLQLVRGQGRDRRLEVDDISQRLKALARTCKVPVLSLSQLSRAVEQRQDHKPMLSDLRESGGLEQDADLVLALHREEVFNPNTDRKNIADLIVLKHRNGQTGSIPLRWMPNHVRFADLETYRAGEGA